MIEKNQSYTALVEDLTLDGSGVCKVDGFAVFVPMTAVGDKIRFKAVKVLKNYGYGILEEILVPSDDRIQVDCPSFKKCGGCSFRHLSYEAELRLKEKAVRDAFQRIGGFTLEPEPIMGASVPEYYRNKAQYPLGVDEKGNAVAGFYAKRSHRIIQTDCCRIQDKRFAPIVQWILRFINEHKISVYDEETGKGLLRHIYLRVGRSSGEMMVCLVATGKKLPFSREFAQELQRQFPQVTSVILNRNARNTNVILGDEFYLLSGNDSIKDVFLDKEFCIAPSAFYQVNKEQAERLYSLAFEYAQFTGKELLLDLYCGIGSIGLSAYSKVDRLIGVEVVAPAVESARKNSALNGADRAEFICADAKKAAKDLAQRGLKPDVILVDPPRQGCEREVLESIVQMAPEKVVMISCNPSTAARDCKILLEQGYELIKYRGVDMFPRTGHVETVVLLSKGEIDSKKVRVEFSLEDMDMSGFQKGATYEQIKAYVLEHTGLKVSSLYISQIKRKCGLDVGQNYNLSKKEDAKVPKCPPEKEAAIRDALKYFQMI